MAADRVDVVPLTEAHVDEIISNVRDMDRREIYLLSTLDPGRAIRATVANAESAVAGYYGGKLACVFGVNRQSLLSDVGVPWLIGSPVVDDIPISFLRHSRQYYLRLVASFPQMENWVLAENVKAVQWLSWLGFDMDEPAPFGVLGAKFIRFTKGFHDVR